MTVLRARALDAQGNPVVGRTAVLEAWTGNRYQSPYNGPQAVRGLTAVSASDGWMQWTLPALQRRPGPRGTLWVITGLEAAPVVVATQPGDTTTTGVRVGTISLADGSFVPTPSVPVDTASEAAAAAQAAVSAVTAGAPLSLDTLAEIAAVLNGRLADTALKTGYAAADMPSSLPAGTVLAHRYDPLRQAYNANPDTLRRWLSALARMKATGGTPARVNVVGHSYVVGTATSPRHTGSFATKLRDLFNAKYGSAGTGIVHLVTTSISDDPRIVFTGTWAAAIGTRGAFNAACYNATGTANKIAFTPDIPVDSFTVYYVRNINSQTFTISVDGGTATSVNAHVSGTEDIQAVTIPAGSLGTHTLTITAPASGQAYIAAVEGTVGSSGVRVSRVGRSGATVSTVTAPGVAGSDSLSTIFTPLAAPDLTVICCQVNDYLSVVGTAAYTANLTTLVNKAKASGDVLVIADPNVMTQPNTAGDRQSAYHAALYGLADSLGFAVLDIAARWKDYPTAVAVPPGFMAAPAQDASGVHPYYVGHQDIANAIFAVIDTAANPVAQASFVPRTDTPNSSVLLGARGRVGLGPAIRTPARIGSAGHGWSIAGGVDDATVKMLGELSYKVTTGGTGVTITLNGPVFTTPQDWSKSIPRFLFRIDDLTKVNFWTISIVTGAGNVFTSGGGLASYVTAISNEWAVLTLPRGFFTVSTGTPAWTGVTQVQINLKDKAAGGFTFWTHGVDLLPDLAATYPNGVFILEADDGYASQKTMLLPLAEGLGVPVTLPLIIERVTSGQAGMTVADLKAFERSGHQLASHAYSSAFHGTAGASAATAEADFTAQQRWYDDNGLDGSMDYACCPGTGSVIAEGSALMDVVRRRFRSVRNNAGYYETAVPPDPHRFRSLLYAGDTAVLTTHINRMTTPGGVFLLAMHEIIAGSTDGTASGLTAPAYANLKTALQLAASNGMAFRTRADLLAGR